MSSPMSDPDVSLDATVAELRRLIAFARERRYGHVNVPIPDIERLLGAMERRCLRASDVPRGT